MDLKTSWYMYIPGQSKSGKASLRWATVNEHWLEISAKPNDAPVISIHLGFAVCAPPPQDDPNQKNSLIVTCDPLAGGFSIKLWTNIRFDIIDLHSAIIKGQDAWKQLREKGECLQRFEGPLKDKKSGFLGWGSVNCQISSDGLKIKKSSNQISTIEFDKICFVRPVPFDQKQGTCFEVSMSISADSTIIMQCRDQREMKMIVEVLLYHLSKIRT
jgi:hypothetical protein